MDLPLFIDGSLMGLLFLGVGWYGGGVSLHDHSDATNGGLLGLNTVQQSNIVKPSIGTPELKTATGSMTTAGAANITLNDCAFFPSISDSGAVVSPQLQSHGSFADPGNTIATFGVINVSTLITVRWKYITASDKPTIWAVLDPLTGKPVAVWVSDDPIPGDLPGIEMKGFPPAVRINLNDIVALNLPASDIVLADAYIAANKLNQANLHYRALQLHTGDAAPSKWIMDNCQVDAGGKLQLQPAKTAAAALDVQPITPGLIARLWSWINPT